MMSILRMIDVQVCERVPGHTVLLRVLPSRASHESPSVSLRTPAPTASPTASATHNTCKEKR